MKAIVRYRSSGGEELWGAVQKKELNGPKTRPTAARTGIKTFKIDILSPLAAAATESKLNSTLNSCLDGFDEDCRPSVLRAAGVVGGD